MIKDYKLTIEGLKNFYRIGGEKRKPPAIFLHGYGARLDGIGPYRGTAGIIEELANHFYVLAPELPGLIRSDAPKTVWNYEEYAILVRKLVRSLQWKRSMIFGHSFGGGVATAYAKLYPEDTKALIIIDSVVSNLPMNSYRKLLYAWARLRKKLLPSPFIPAPVKKVSVTLWFGTPWKFIDDKSIKEKIIMSDIDLTRNLVVDYKKLEMPFIMIWGNKDTWVTPLYRAKEIHQEVPSSKLILVEGGHAILSIKPKYVIHEIIKNLPHELYR
ncbi:MAG: alpha/beta hydrolase [Candidatus Portnoybacteria bacterium]|nr:alpha/beta hydrolase [Candidatus Portnoybacteria bacterium]